MRISPESHTLEYWKPHVKDVYTALSYPYQSVQFSKLQYMEVNENFI